MVQFPGSLRLLRLWSNGGLVGFALVIHGCGGSGADHESPPARVEKPVTEAELTTIHLTAQAEQRIGIEVVAAERRGLHQRRTLGGELIVPPGSGVTVAAPRAATVFAPDSGQPPVVGSWVSRGQTLLRLVMLPADLTRAQEELTVAEARVANARAKARRAEDLLRQGVGAQAEYEDAQAELASAEAVLLAARARMDLLQTGHTDVAITDLSPITLTAPEAGIVQSVRFAVGQTVSDGTTLMEIVKPDPLWVRVPVYVGELASIDRQAPVTVVGPGDPPEAEGRSAQPIAGSPMADPTTVSADLFYLLRNADARFRPGQRVGVSVEYTGVSEAVTVPRSAILHDIYGGTWVYESLGDHVFTRRRVEVRDVVEGYAVLTRGLAPGSRVVAVGAAELYSTEFGISH